MRELQTERSTAILFITHDLGVVNEMADDVAVMYCGQVVERVPAPVIFSKTEYSHPYTDGLLSSIPSAQIAKKRLESISGSVPHPLHLPKGCKFAPRCKYCTKKCIENEPDLFSIKTDHHIRCFYPSKKERRSSAHADFIIR
jgi:peptide/nickel transport system ATP-binding protein